MLDATRWPARASLCLVMSIDRPGDTFVLYLFHYRCHILHPLLQLLMVHAILFPSRVDEIDVFLPVPLLVRQIHILLQLEPTSGRASLRYGELGDVLGA